MKKRIKLFSSALAISMLLGTAAPAITVQHTPTTTAKASEQSTRSEQITIDKNDVTIDPNTGLITDFTNAEKAESLLAGGELVIPETIGEGEDMVTVTGIAEKESSSDDGVFGITSLKDLAPTSGSGISSVSFAKPENIKIIGLGAFHGNQLTALNLPAATEIGNGAFADNQLTALSLPATTEIGDAAFADNQLTALSLPTATEIGDAAFNNNQLTELNLPKAIEIGRAAFVGNHLTSLNLPATTRIGESAFNSNQLTSLNLPEAIEIDDRAFVSNHLTSLNLPVATKIGESAFAANALLSIELNRAKNIESSAFVGQNISHEVMPNKEGEIEFAALKPTLLKGTDDQIKALPNVTFGGEESIKLENGVTLKVDNENKKITDASHPEPYSVNLETDLETEGSLPGNYSIDSYKLTINPFEENTDGGSQPGNGSNSGETGTDPDNGNSGESGNNGSETKPQPTPKPEEKRPHTVYAKRGMRLHRNVSLTSPIKSFKKQSRAKAPSFRVRGIEYDKNGKKRYKVDGGYITAGSSYVADSHFRSNKVRQVRVLSNRINSYKDVKLSSNKKVRSYKKGTKLKVKRIVNYGRATRFELTNGRYITGNKQLLIMDQK